jgi:hypothetical protein
MTPPSSAALLNAEEIRNTTAPTTTYPLLTPIIATLVLLVILEELVKLTEMVLYADLENALTVVRLV